MTLSSLEGGRWEIAQVPENKPQMLKRLLDEGWEPYSSVVVYNKAEIQEGQTLKEIMSGRPGGQCIIHCLRRQK